MNVSPAAPKVNFSQRTPPAFNVKPILSSRHTEPTIDGPNKADEQEDIGYDDSPETLELLAGPPHHGLHGERYADNCVANYLPKHETVYWIAINYATVRKLTLVSGFVLD